MISVLTCFFLVVVEPKKPALGKVGHTRKKALYNLCHTKIHHSKVDDVFYDGLSLPPALVEKGLVSTKVDVEDILDQHNATFNDLTTNSRVKQWVLGFVTPAS